MNIPLRNTDAAYGLVAQLLHWLVVVGLLLQFIWVWRIDEADSIRLEYQLIVQHKSIGMSVLLLAVVRILWRLFDRPPPATAGTPAWQRRAAGFTHWALYALILLLPLSGWIYSSAAGYGAEFFGLLEIPDLVGTSESLEDAFHEIHELLATALLVLAGVHVAAALQHQFILKDGLMRRMLPAWKRDD